MQPIDRSAPRDLSAVDVEGIAHRAAVTGARAESDDAAAVLLVDAASRRVVHASSLAVQLAPDLPLPAGVDAWSDAAGLRDIEGEELSDTSHPLSLAARGEPVAGQPVTARRSSQETAVREPLLAIGLPLGGAPSLGGYRLIVLLPLRDREAVADARGAAVTGGGAGLRDRAVRATGISFTLADATAEDVPLMWSNPAFTATTGYTHADVLGRNCRFLQGPGTDPAAVAELRDAVDHHRDVTVTLLNYRKDATAFWNQVSMSPVRDGEGRVTHFVGVQADVTERVEADLARQRALAAEQVARAEADAAQTEAERARADAERSRADAEAARQVAEQALTAAKRSGDRLALVAEATGLLASTLDVDESLDRLTRLVVPLLADWVVIALSDDGRRVGRAIARHRDGRTALLERYTALLPEAIDAGSAVHTVLSAGRSLIQSPAQPVTPHTPAAAELAALTTLLGVGSRLAVPLAARRRVVGAMMLVNGPDSPLLTDIDLDLAVDLGRRAGLAVDNAQLYTRQHDAAVTLQRGLLPQLPDVPGLALAAQYLPAGRENEVGGDWWDVFALPDGATALAIGDVMGHDLSAAVAMGQLRSVLRTCAWAGDSPSQVLDRMDQLVQGFDMAQLATCVYARVQPVDQPDGVYRRRRTPRLIWGSAGHLPPVLITPDGDARLLTEAAGVPLGVPVDEARRPADLSVTPGSTVLLYTDGLVESRGSDIDADLADLVDVVRGHLPHHGPQALVDRLTGRAGELDDDVAVLAAQVL